MSPHSDKMQAIEKINSIFINALQIGPVVAIANGEPYSCTDQGKTTMTHRTPHFAPVTGFMRQYSLSFLMPFFRKTDCAPMEYPKFESSVFSRPDQSELIAMEEEISPLLEAEVYLIYGRKADAEKVLADGVKTGRITADEAGRFWSEQNNTRGRASAN